MEEAPDSAGENDRHEPAAEEQPGGVRFEQALKEVDRFEVKAEEFIPNFDCDDEDTMPPARREAITRLKNLMDEEERSAPDPGAADEMDDSDEDLPGTKSGPGGHAGVATPAKAQPGGDVEMTDPKNEELDDAAGNEDKPKSSSPRGLESRAGAKAVSNPLGLPVCATCGTLLLEGDKWCIGCGRGYNIAGARTAPQRPMQLVQEFHTGLLIARTDRGGRTDESSTRRAASEKNGQEGR